MQNEELPSEVIRRMLRADGLPEDVPDVAKLIADIRKWNPHATYASIAAFVGVRENTVARWATGRMEADRADTAQYKRLVLLRAQTRCPHVLVVPAIVGLWAFREDIPPKELEEAERLPERDFFAPRIGVEFVNYNIATGPRAAGKYVKYTLELQASFDFITLFAFGLERDLVRLHSYAAAPAEGGPSARFDQRQPPPGWSRRDRERRAREDFLTKGSELELFVSYRM